MKLETEILRLNNNLSFVGINPATGKCNGWVYAYFFFVMCQIVNNIFYVHYKWESFHDRVIGMKVIIDCMVLSSYAMILCLHWDTVVLSLRTIENGFIPIPYKNSTKRDKVIKKNQNTMAKMSFYWYYALTINAAVGCVIPILSLVYIIIRKGTTDIKADEPILLFPFYFPENHKSLYMFFVAYVVQNWHHMVGVKYAYVCVVGTYPAIQSIVSEFQLLQTSIEEINSRIENRNMPKVLPDAENEGDLDYYFLYSYDEELLAMKFALRYLVKHHLELYRRIEKVNKSVQWYAVISHFGVTVFGICFGLLYIVKGNDTAAKVQVGGIIILCTGAIYEYDKLGENILTEVYVGMLYICKLYAKNEKLRSALYGCLWMSKPQWFKKSIQLILTRMARTAEMKPIGLFVLDLKTFTLVMNAAYSYYNLLTKL